MTGYIEGVTVFWSRDIYYKLEMPMFSGGYIHVFSLSHAFQIFDDVAVVETKFCTNCWKSLDCFPVRT